MNAASLYRAQQLAIAAAIDSGQFDLASDLLRRDVREFARPPERSGTTGHNRTLTPRRKCGIIKAIKRHLSRRKKQEGKTMKFEAGKFYIHDTSEYEYSDNSKQYLYCRKIYNANADIPNAEPFLIAELIGIDGEGISNRVHADGTPYDSEKWYTETSKEVFALALLDVAVKGCDFLSEQIQRRRIAEIEEKENDDSDLFDFGF